MCSPVASLVCPAPFHLILLRPSTCLMCPFSCLLCLVHGPHIPGAYSGVSFGSKQIIYRRSDFTRAFIRSRHVALQGGIILGC